MSLQQLIPPSPPRSPRKPRALRMLVAGVLLTAVTVAAWLSVCPWDWRTAAPDVSPMEVRPWQWGVIGIVLLALAVAAGAAGHRLLALVCVATPACALFCYQSAVFGGDELSIVGTIGVLPVLYGSLAIAAGLGHLARCRTVRTTTEG